MSTYQTEAIVIRSQDFSEADILLTLFTQKHGKIRGIIKSGRKSISKLAGPCQFLNQILVSVYGKPQVELQKITQVDMVKSREKLRDDLQRLSWASLYVEFLQRTTGDHEHDQELFDMTTFFLDKLLYHRNYLNHTLLYLFHLLQVTGFSPLLSQCVKCGKSRPSSNRLNHSIYYFDSRKGGILCTSCRSKTSVKSGLFPISSYQMQFVDHSMKYSYQDNPRLRLDDSQGKSLLELLLAHACHQLEGDFNSVGFLQTMDYLSQPAKP